MSEFSKYTYSDRSFAVPAPSIGGTGSGVRPIGGGMSIDWDMSDMFGKNRSLGMTPAEYAEAMRRLLTHISVPPHLSMTAGQHVSPAVLVDMIHSRMRIHKPEKAPDFISAHYHQNHNKVSVFIAHEGQSVVLTDEATLFPSDTMITQIRMLTG